MGSSLFWFDNWMGMGSLYFLMPQNFGIDESIHNVYDIVEEDTWNVNKILETLPEEYVLHIVERIKPPTLPGVLDKPYWMLDSHGKFTVKTAWEYLRRRNDTRIAYKMIWVKGLPFKISFFMWKVWKDKLSLDDFMKRLGYLMPSKCCCCEKPQEETLSHLFFTSHAANRVWNYFLTREGIRMEGLTLHQVVTRCWNARVLHRIKPIMQALPSCIVWELWKRRNSRRYGEAVTVNRVIYQISTTMQLLVKVRKPGLQSVPHTWNELLQSWKIIHLVCRWRRSVGNFHLKAG